MLSHGSNTIGLPRNLLIQIVEREKFSKRLIMKGFGVRSQKNVGVTPRRRLCMHVEGLETRSLSTTAILTTLMTVPRIHAAATRGHKPEGLTR